ncbi:MAG: hypothetical protein Q9Q40_03610 [Acidobacteriota bacterium]|nr:hypothetical protein [Acidobacteriota bacterium]
MSGEDAGVARADRGRHLALHLPGGLLLLDVEVAGRVEPALTVLPVPHSPEGVIGLAELRGRPVTLIDPSVWLEGRGRLASSPAELGAGGVQALLLAPPLNHLAFGLPPSATLRPLRGSPESGVVLDAKAIVARFAPAVQPAP